MIDQETKNTIDHMSYETMFSKWRFAKSGDCLLQGDVGEYFAKVMREKRQVVGADEHTRISKSLGWG